MALQLNTLNLGGGQPLATARNAALNQASRQARTNTVIAGQKRAQDVALNLKKIDASLAQADVERKQNQVKNKLALAKIITNNPNLTPNQQIQQVKQLGIFPENTVFIPGNTGEDLRAVSPTDGSVARVSDATDVAGESFAEPISKSDLAAINAPQSEARDVSGTVKELEASRTKTIGIINDTSGDVSDTQIKRADRKLKIIEDNLKIARQAQAGDAFKAHSDAKLEVSKMNQNLSPLELSITAFNQLSETDQTALSRNDTFRKESLGLSTAVPETTEQKEFNRKSGAGKFDNFTSITDTSDKAQGSLQTIGLARTSVEKGTTGGLAELGIFLNKIAGDIPLIGNFLKRFTPDADTNIIVRSLASQFILDITKKANGGFGLGIGVTDQDVKKLENAIFDVSNPKAANLLIIDILERKLQIQAIRGKLASEFKNKTGSFNRENFNKFAGNEEINKRLKSRFDVNIEASGSPVADIILKIESQNPQRGPDGQTIPQQPTDLSGFSDAELEKQL